MEDVSSFMAYMNDIYKQLPPLFKINDVKLVYSNDKLVYPSNVMQRYCAFYYDPQATAQLLAYFFEMKGFVEIWYINFNFTRWFLSVYISRLN